jgi:nitrogenase molybdenum-iron protein alpha chain
MKLVGYKPHNFDQFAMPYLDGESVKDAVVQVAPGQPAEELSLLKRLKPDLYVGHTGANGWVTKLGIPNLPLYGQLFNYMGYSGAYELARKAAKVIKNTAFVRGISRNTTLPFRPEWYERDPADNIKNLDSSFREVI